MIEKLSCGILCKFSVCHKTVCNEISLCISMEVGSEVLSVITQCLREQHSEYDYYSKHIILVFKHFIMP